MKLDALLACRTDREKALIDGFQRNFCFATFLRCFAHLTELKNGNISCTQQKLYIQESFGRKRTRYDQIFWTCRRRIHQRFWSEVGRSEGLTNDWNNCYKQEKISYCLIWINVFKCFYVFMLMSSQYCL